MKLQKEREEKAEGVKDRSQWMTDDRIYLEMEKAKKDKQHDANVELQKFRIQQMVNRSVVPFQPFQKEACRYTNNTKYCLQGRDRKHAVCDVFCL